MKVNIYICLFILCFINACIRHEKSQTKYFFCSGRLVKEQYDIHDRLLSKGTYNKDTLPLGYYVEYYSNNKISKWLWYDKPKDYPLFGLYFDSLGNYIKYGGSPFVRSIWTINKEKAIEIVNPPDIYYLIVYEDYFDKKLIEKNIYEPAKSDTTSWVVIENLKEYKRGHQYFIKYVLFDKNMTPIDSVRTEITP